MTDWNQLFKQFRVGLSLDKGEVAEICLMGGLEISNSKAEAWARGSSDKRRHIRMSEEEFKALMAGFAEWGRQNIASPSTRPKDSTPKNGE